MWSGMSMQPPPHNPLPPFMSTTEPPRRQPRNNYSARRRLNKRAVWHGGRRLKVETERGKKNGSVKMWVFFSEWLFILGSWGVREKVNTRIFSFSSCHRPCPLGTTLQSWYDIRQLVAKTLNEKKIFFATDCRLNVIPCFSHTL